MKIIIIGAGVAGLSSYLSLHKHLTRDHIGEHTITIYEGYDVKRLRYDTKTGEASGEDAREGDMLFTPKTIGNAIGLGKNGLAVLRRLDENGSILKRIQSRGNCVSKWRMGTARGWRIVDVNVQSSTEGSRDSGEEMIASTVMIARQVAWEVLRDAVLDVDPNAIVQKKVTHLEEAPKGSAVQKLTLHFTEGTQDFADLLIGADGLHSIVRETMFANYNELGSQSWLDWLLRRPPVRKDYITPRYQGLTGLGGFIPADVLAKTDYEHGAMSITFGPNGFFGHGYIGPVKQEHMPGERESGNIQVPLAAWWSTFASEDPRPYQTQPVADNSDTNSTGVKTTLDKERALKECLERHRRWQDPTIQAILDYLVQNEAIEHMYPTYTTPELPNWQHSDHGNMVLVGDAAHALQPSSGQGACQALEDAEALALLLKHHLAIVDDERSTSSAPSRGAKAEEFFQATAVTRALQQFVALRKPRVAMIYKQSQKMSRSKLDMGFVMENFMYVAIWIATKVGAWKKYNDMLFEYNLPDEVEKVVQTGGKARVIV